MMSDNRELSAKIAEEVMGWEPLTHFHGEPIADGWVGFWDGEWFRWTTRPESDEPDASVEWSPFTNIQDAWLVVEHLRKEKRLMWRGGHFAEAGPCTIRFGFAMPNAKEVTYYVDAPEDEVPQAICLAALETLKGDGDDR